MKQNLLATISIRIKAYAGKVWDALVKPQPSITLRPARAKAVVRVESRYVNLQRPDQDPARYWHEDHDPFRP